jgi:flagellar biosynthesis/type III secretory pathway protein FliH
MAVDREAEARRLAEADRHIAEAESAVAKQTMELEKLRRDGHQTDLAEGTVRAFQESLETLRESREQIAGSLNGWSTAYSDGWLVKR